MEAREDKECDKKGTTKISSISNTTKITAKIKKRRETGCRASTAVVNPHSRGEIVSRLEGLILLKADPIKMKRIPRAIASNVKTLHINILN